MDLVSIVVPTLNRQKSLVRALLSLGAQQGLVDTALEIIVVDNSADATARAAVGSLPALSWPVRYLSEPRPGVATARNSGVAAARGRWVAFLDDDEEASPGWVAALVATARASGADAVFGPVDARADGAGEIGPLAPYFSRTLERPDAADITDCAAYLGTNNSMFDRLRCLTGAETFDDGLNETGGEDSLLLRQLVLSGRRFHWAAGARVTEWAAEKRLNWAYVRKRKFLSGQIRVFVHHMTGPARWLNILTWMGVGLVQVVLAGSAALLLRPFAPERADKAAATAFGGLGKVLWAPRFRPALYGSGLVS